MKMTNSTKIALLSLVGILVIVFAGIYFVKPNIEEKRNIDTECVELQTRLDDLLRKEADRPKYEAGIIEYENKYQEVLSSFPADLNQEISIMFMQGIKDNNEFKIDNLELGEKEEFYTLGSNGADATIDTTAETDSAEGTENTDVASEETTDTSEESATAEGELAVEGDTTDPNALVCYRASLPLTYYGSYNSLKDVVAYIDTYSDRMTVNNLSITYTDDGIYEGDMGVMCYSVEGESRPERNIDLNNIEVGVDNIFGGSAGSSTNAGSSLNKYDENDGIAIETSYDFYTMVNAASSDVSAKVVGQNGAGKDSSVISNSDNTISTVNYEFYEKDGKNYCKYTLDDSKSYEAEITSVDDIKILVQSSERKGEDDKVKVKMTIDNQTSMPVYVKVSGDDAVSPRVNISKTGLVKVYQ